MQPADRADRVLPKIALTAALVIAGLAFARSAASGPSRYMLVDELIASGLIAHEGQELRVNGVVVGPITRVDDETTRFVLMRNGLGLPAIVHGTLPDTFREQTDVIVTGSVVHHDTWLLDGTMVIAKCPTRYDGGRPPLAKFE